MFTKPNFSRQKRFFYLIALFIGLALLASQASGQSAGIQIIQSRGVDQAVVYRELVKFGPWDDRNYNLTSADLKLLAPNESELHPQIPAFFRVELRREWPHLKRTGAAALQLFRIRYGGLMQNGVIENDHRIARAAALEPRAVNSEIQLNQVLGANEVTVEINPSNPQQVIAGANNNGGQEMYYSTDGGTSWTIQGVLPNTCCDPTVDWSADGSVAYVAALSGSIGVSAWRSFDGGQTWVDRVILTSSGSDKEFIHSDKSQSSPHKDNVYLTYHNGNTMQFARSTDMGGTYAIQAFPAEPSGIGSDITTDAAGNIYYFYGAFNTQEIILLKSTDGGLSFQPGSVVATTNGSFDFPIPSMESRRAWIYAAADADRSGGAFDGSIYVSWTDTVDPETNNANLNHTLVYVAYSRDGGSTWNLSVPHSTTDMMDVDRWNQWLTVDENGTVHVVYYDTRNSVGRTGVDLYYAYSVDGGVSWNTPERISSETSANLTDGQEFGDYNGISVFGAKGIPVWTDNRDGPPNAKDVYAADFTNETAAPGFSLSGSPLDQEICAPGNLADIDVSVGAVQAFTNPVTLSYSGLPGGSSGAFTVNPVVPGNSSVAQVFIGPVTTGDYDFQINGAAADADDKSLTVNVAAFDGAPGAVTLVAPADGATDLSTAPTLSWNAVNGASSYLVEVDDDPGFGSVDFSTTTEDTSASISPGLDTETTYYWRVQAVNPCGGGSYSPVFSFSTGLVICRSGFGPIPDAGATSDTLVVGQGGALTDLNLSLRVTHTYVGDLAFSLVHEDTGTSVAVFDRPGVPGSQFGCGGDDIDVILDDDGTAPVETTCSNAPAISGTLIPNAALAAFNGEDLSGSWRLDISDNAGSDIGTLDEWCLLPATSTEPTDSDGDGVPDADDNCPDTPNPGQEDGNNDGVGDACQPLCDIDLNGQIDRADLRRIFLARNRPTIPGDPRDSDGNGFIDAQDFQLCRSLCTNPGCAL
jgi:subtilisin-like proprotein convertase family protein